VERPGAQRHADRRLGLELKARAAALPLDKAGSAGGFERLPGVEDNTGRRVVGPDLDRARDAERIRLDCATPRAVQRLCYEVQGARKTTRTP
jgi:hypothetical protein